MNDYSFKNTVIESELEKNGTYASVTKGVSMRPLFKTNRDVIILKKPDRELRRYDVVLYRSLQGAYTLHRIIRVTDDEYVIRGDNTYRNEHVAKERVIAVLSEFNRKGKRHYVEDFSYRLYSRVWNFIYPIRYLCFRLRAIAYRILKGKSNDRKDNS